MHWIDPSTRELLDLMVERVARLPVLLLSTFRPEFVPPWVGQPHVTALLLSRLGRREGAVLVRRVAGGSLLDALVDEIVERTDGVPLFVEELTKAVLEAGGDAARTLAAVSPAMLAVPATLHASLMARLDRLGPAAREVAQVGAAIGREFSHELLAAVAGLGEDGLAAALDQLVAAGLVFRRGDAPAAATCSSTRWSATRPTARSCASGGAGSTPVSPARSRSGSPRADGSPSCWRTT